MVAIHDIPDSRPFQKVLTRLSNKWNVLVIRRLAKKTMRHSQLKRDIGNISQKMLTQTLRELERSGLIERKVFPVIPPKVEYSLTDLGKTLVEPLNVLCGWAIEHIDEVESAVESYDVRKELELEQ
ncbi:MAG: helix-turn-helix transcriptional regulator [Rhodospirillaceae bacterium]|jgi:DNA-binding HxlR family transcriptional regulator|nr:helix-turn-helix transcriptional regulator [Rhodospirillales bacterium]MBT3904983.1 helix-turn-helix transcriptional regulator [Rhodospirillaceae bacterium]MBT4702065.1 helix-turn-helix transcriptional regulator [Rhodospirillaceae bacterium]MBT5034691.1 helix-turn-helix transcriptional regulator [Rhodospirillaceae bacterium]MBT6222065.1 helix-turn-helix transcriptional regulator [Rhodospirillaceae bacterium]